MYLLSRCSAFYSLPSLLLRRSASQAFFDGSGSAGVKSLIINESIPIEARQALLDLMIDVSTVKEAAAQNISAITAAAAQNISAITAAAAQNISAITAAAAQNISAIKETLSSVKEALWKEQGRGQETMRLLEAAKGLLGVDEDKDNGDEAFLRDIYSERFEPRDDADEDINAPFGSALLCEICERHTKLTRHHLYPKQLHGKLEGRVPANLLNRTLNICRMCHSTVHRLFTNEELAASYNTLESLMATEPMAKYAKWASMVRRCCCRAARQCSVSARRSGSQSS